MTTEAGMIPMRERSEGTLCRNCDTESKHGRIRRAGRLALNQPDFFSLSLSRSNLAIWSRRPCAVPRAG